MKTKKTQLIKISVKTEEGMCNGFFPSNATIRKVFQREGVSLTKRYFIIKNNNLIGGKESHNKTLREIVAQDGDYLGYLRKPKKSDPMRLGPLRLDK